MNIQTLRYLIEIERAGSINKAAQQLFISQSTLSRYIKELESQINIVLFQRSNKGVTVTHDGKVFISKVMHMIETINQIEDEYFNPVKRSKGTLLIATQRCSVVVEAILAYYQAFCKDENYLNIVLLEETTQNIINLISGRVCNIGILHYTSDREDSFLEMCQSLDFEYHLLDRSPISAQFRNGHPLSNEDNLTVDMLAPYPHVTFSDEDITSINYCSDIFQYNQNILKKRIVVQDRGTLLRIINGTDGYYIGCDFSKLGSIPGIRYKHLRDVDFTLDTIWIQQKGRIISEAEQNFIKQLRLIF
jgi:DNA-binding transcriptional LysR family regulator